MALGDKDSRATMRAEHIKEGAHVCESQTGTWYLHIARAVIGSTDVGQKEQVLISLCSGLYVCCEFVRSSSPWTVLL